ncbi:MAG: hypothetical protein IPM82_26120 [Saprospiraceae bacterium]|nr:hypothetical protein [Saprospiraceae bacterium]
MGRPWKRRLLSAFTFLVFYFLVNIFVVPPLAKWQCGRVPLPVFGHPNLKPHHVIYYCGLNHHYVRPEVKATCERVAEKLASKYPGTRIFYLDANFPFFDGYPLEPHFTHRNGTTVDIALHWLDAKTGKQIEGAPTALAYGVSATPLSGEVDLDEKCGNWLRNIEMNIVQHFYNKENYQLDEARTGEMTRLFSQEKAVRKILLEPHLKTRLGLGRIDKIRFQGCKAARHDDHIHVIW